MIVVVAAPNSCLNPEFPHLNTSEELTIQAFDLVSGLLNTYITKSFMYEDYGNTPNSDKFADLGTELIYLIDYLTIARNSILLKLKSVSCDTFDINTELEVFKISCIKKTFACKNIDITPIIELFSLTPTGLEGINYMQIEGQNCEPFIVK